MNIRWMQDISSDRFKDIRRSMKSVRKSKTFSWAYRRLATNGEKAHRLPFYGETILSRENYIILVKSDHFSGLNSDFFDPGMAAVIL